MSVFVIKALLSFGLALAALVIGWHFGYERGRRRERMSRLDLTGLSLRMTRDHEDPFGAHEGHLTRFHAGILSPVVSPPPANAPTLEDALKKHIRDRRP